MDQLERPQYYEGEYLGADDLQALVRYARAAQARHALGAHVWGIAVGLDLVERALPGDAVEMVLTPGIGWDGHGRTLVALAPQRLPLDLFADLQDDTLPGGVPVEIWLAYRELAAGPPGAGFACPDDVLRGRAVETFRIEVRRSPATDYHSVSIAGRSVEARKALATFDPSKPPLFDESVPMQAFPESGDRQRWPVFVGIVRWRKDAGQPGRLIKRIDDDRNATRRGRRYAGAVAETILAPDGVLRLRDRSKDPADPALNYTAPVVAAPPGTSVVNDLVWCEGHLRVVGDARLQGGKLDYRVEKGGDDGVPMYLRRTVVNAPVLKTTLDAFVGSPAPLPAPVNAQTRFTVSTGNPASATELLTVVNDGRVGINAAEPSNTLHVEGPTGIRYGYGYVTGDPGARWTALAFNAYSPPGGPWVIPDPARRPAAVVLEDVGGVPQVKVQSSVTGSPTAWNVHLVVKGDTGNVGIGTSTPQTKLNVVGNRIRLGDDAKHIDLRTDGGAVDLHSETHDLYIRTLGDAAHPGPHNVLINPSPLEGNVGIGTTAPVSRLHVEGDLWVNGSGFKTTFGGWWLLSDRRLKKDFRPIPDPLAKLLRLHGVSFAWRDPARVGAGKGTYVGFVAQEVEKAFPEWVTTTPAGDKAVNPAGLEALLVEAIRELSARTERLEAEVADLRARLGRQGRREPASGPPRAAAREAKPTSRRSGRKS